MKYQLIHLEDRNVILPGLWSLQLFCVRASPGLGLLLGRPGRGETLWKSAHANTNPHSAGLDGAYTKIGTIQRLARSLYKDDTQICEGLHI